MKHWCWYCRYRGERLRLDRGKGSVFCEHPDKEVAAPNCPDPDNLSPWDILRKAFDTCEHFEEEALTK